MTNKQPALSLASADLEPFREAARNNRLVIKTCESCGRAHWYPRALCPYCFSDQTVWREASGQGHIYSYTVMRKSERPYVLAYVTLDEGPTLLTNIVGPDLESPDLNTAIGQTVKAPFVDRDGEPVLVFRPA